MALMKHTYDPLPWKSSPIRYQFPRKIVLSKESMALQSRRNFFRKLKNSVLPNFFYGMSQTATTAAIAQQPCMLTRDVSFLMYHFF